MAENRKFFKWVGREKVDVIHARVNRVDQGLTFSGEKGHIAATTSAEKIKYFTESPEFQEVSEEDFQSAGGTAEAMAVSSGDPGTGGGTTTGAGATGAGVTGPSGSSTATGTR